MVCPVQAIAGHESLSITAETSVTAGTHYLIRVGFDGVQYPHGDNATLLIDCTN